MELIVRKSRRPLWMTPFGMEPWGDAFTDRMIPWWQREETEEWLPSINFSKKNGNYLLTAELPGISKEDIEVKIDEGVLTVSGKKEHHTEEKEADYYFKETSSGSFSRSIKLPGSVEEEKVEATFKDGVLTVTLPHKEEPETKTIKVK